jgi:hypothetical protein
MQKECGIYLGEAFIKLNTKSYCSLYTEKKYVIPLIEMEQPIVSFYLGLWFQYKRSVRISA